MLDAMSKLPSSLLSYNFEDMGHFEQCIKVKSQRDRVTSKYCLGEITFSKIDNNHSKLLEQQDYLKHVQSLTPGPYLFQHPRWAMCLPSNCTDEDAIYLMDILQTQGASIRSVNCQTINDANPPLDTGAIFGMSVAGILLLLVIISTACDIHYKKSKKESPSPGYTAFSLYTNGKKIFVVTKRSTPLCCLDDIKAVSMIWVIVYHFFLDTASGQVFDHSNTIDITTSLPYLFITNGTFACDTFFVAGGTLVTYLFFKKEKKGRMTFLDVVKHYIHRYVRLAPPLAGVVLLSATLLTYMGSGPRWHFIKEVFRDPCRKYWWTSLLFIQNQVNVEEMCSQYTWYLEVDMQLYIFSPLIFWMLQQHSELGITALVVGALASMVTAFYNAYEHQLPAFQQNYYSKISHAEYLERFYLKTESRASSWLIGAILGYLLTRNRFTEVRLSKKITIPLWILLLTVLLICTLGGHSTLRGPEDNIMQNALYIALVRPSFALTVAFIIWMCVTNHGGFINTILSLTVFQFLSKFTYSMYLIHVSILSTIIFSNKTAVNYTWFGMVLLFWGILVLMFGLSVIMVLVFEIPIVTLEKLVLQKVDSISKPLKENTPV